MITAIILAAGNGTRYGERKQFSVIAGKPVIEWTIDSLRNYVDEMVVVMPADSGRVNVVQGGATRYDSIKAGFEMVEEGSHVLVADAVRCNTSGAIVERLIAEIDKHAGAFPALKATNTVCYPGQIIDKNDMYEVQTPEAVRYLALEKAIGACGPKDGFSIMWMLQKAHIYDIVDIPGERGNIKITYPEDRVLFEVLVGMKDAVT